MVAMVPELRLHAPRALKRTGGVLGARLRKELVNFLHLCFGSGTFFALFSAATKSSCALRATLTIELLDATRWRKTERTTQRATRRRSPKYARTVERAADPIARHGRSRRGGQVGVWC